MPDVRAHVAHHEAPTNPSATNAAPAPRRREGLTRWERMERETLTLERIAELHAAAYRAENKSERTVEWHTEVLTRYATWVQAELGEAPCLASFTLDQVRAYIAHLRLQTCWMTRAVMPEAARSRPLSDGTVSWHVRGLRAIASWLQSEGYTAENVLARLKPPKVADYDVDILSDLHFDQGYMVVFGKGRKERPVKVGSRAIKAMRFYMTHWRSPARPLIDRVFLTVGRPMGKYEDLWVGGGEQLTVNALKLLTKRIGVRAGVPRLHPHLLRHTFACLYLMQHHDPFALKNLLGHTSLAMTYRYVRAVERLMVVRGSGASVLDSIALPLHSRVTATLPGRKAEA
jgi:site-specific recombinase XerD